MNTEGPPFTQTPLFRALQSDRYARQALIASIEGITGRELIVYEANPLSAQAMLSREDIQPFTDLLIRVTPAANVDLMLHSLGGDIDAAEKIVYMCRSRVSSLRVIVPEYAKSAATLIALASDEVVMGLASELGPIDPQIMRRGPGGTVVYTSAQCFIDEFDSIKKEVEAEDKLSPAYFPLLDGLDLGFMRMCRNHIARSKNFATKWLTRYMLKDNPQAAAEIAEKLGNVQQWLSHGAVVDAEESSGMGIKVKTLGQEEPLWQHLWYLHCCYGAMFRKQPAGKVYESKTVSLVFE